MAFRGVDAVVVRVPSLEAGLGFYRDALGHPVTWRRPDAVGLRMGDGPTELVLMTSIDAETDLLVDNVDQEVEMVIDAGGSVVSGPFAIDVGRAAVVRDPFGNVLTLVDLSRGRYVTADDGTVTGIAPGPGWPGAW
jgi:catechol 2,3-dioxygenase-like lactoylglutathione lyase family enzyme